MRSTGAITSRPQQAFNGGANQVLALTTTETPKPMDGTGSRWTQGAIKRAGLLDADQQQWQDLSPLVRHWR